MEEGIETRLAAIEERLEEQEKLLLKIWRKSSKNTRQLDQVAIAFLCFLGLLLVFAFGVQIKLDWISFDLQGETLVRVIEVSGLGAALGALAKWVIDKIRKEEQP